MTSRRWTATRPTPVETKAHALRAATAAGPLTSVVTPARTRARLFGIHDAVLLASCTMSGGATISIRTTPVTAPPTLRTTAPMPTPKTAPPTATALT